MEEECGHAFKLFRGGAKKRTRAIAVCCYETYKNNRREETDGTKKYTKYCAYFFFLLKALHHDKNMHYVR